MLKERDKTKYIKRVASPQSLIKKVPYAGTLLAFQHLFRPPVCEKKTSLVPVLYLGSPPSPLLLSVLVTPARLFSSLRSLPPANGGDSVSKLSLAGRPRHCGITLCGQAPCHLHVLRTRGRTAGGKRREEERKRKQAQEMKKKCAKGTKDQETAL